MKEKIGGKAGNENSIYETNHKRYRNEQLQ